MTEPGTVLLAVPNISEGRDRHLVSRIAGEASLLDVHIDPDHNRSVLTYAGPAPDVVSACVAMTERAVELLDVRSHEGVHPRFGVIDVVPFVHHLCDLETAVGAARAYADAIPIPVHLYGEADPERTALPNLRRRLQGIAGHPSAGVVCVGVRPPLIAFNVDLGAPLAVAREIARSIRGPDVRALAFELLTRGIVQVSTNLIEPSRTGPRAVFDRVSASARAAHVDIVGAEVVGLVPESCMPELASIPLGRPARSVEGALRIVRRT